MEIITVGPFLDYFERVRERTLKVVRAIPRERIDWTYREGKFTFADVVRHLGAIERFMYAENARLNRAAIRGTAKSWPTATTKS